MTTRRIQIGGVDLEWKTEEGLFLWSGGPALSMWIESSFAGLMSGLHSMVGTERFNLCLLAGARAGVSGDATFLGSFPTFEEGFAALAEIAALAGWGVWEIAFIDREAKRACFRIINCWEARYQKALGVAWGSYMSAGKFAGQGELLFGVPCWTEQTKFIVHGDAYDEFLVTPATLTIEEQLASLVAEEKATSADLALALEKLRREVEERVRTEADLRDKLALIERQEAAIRALSNPIIEVWDDVLALPMIGIIDSQRAAQMMDRLLGEVVRTGCRFAILDLTGVELLDTSSADHVIKLVRAVELLGARAIITGIRPAVAQTIILLGVDLSSMTTVANLREGLKLAMRVMRTGR
ncbi:STAS domain-containing protein [Polyangium aurulentum]|uniref:STAS domain-containing protein n=1 Tax=Polyangium aurulentum TaxID=2567896 RepID=UPI0010ADC052|nr:STAS domain-containing protein [Polyangium aurulentum]UQA58920.1 STAS domain-containing protein [Polyangium aurulentum]